VKRKHPILAFPSSPRFGAVPKSHPALLRVQFSGASFHGDGALHPRLLVDNTAVKLEVDVHHVQGSGYLVANVDFFNSHVQMWEPVVELWRPDLLIKKQHQGRLDIEISASRTLQINLSGRMIDSLVKAYSLLLQRGETGVETSGQTDAVQP
jgi:hypothetical protein